MTGSKRNILLALSLVLMTTMVAGNALAQRSGGGGKPPIEISATYGSMWGGNIGTIYGTLRTSTGPSYGIQLAIPVQPAMAVELSYTRQDGGLDWDYPGGKDHLTDMSVNYWQIGAVRGLLEGKVRPFVSTTLGVTYYSPENGTVTVDDGNPTTPDEYHIGTQTNFSMTIGVGAKAYFGKAERFGIKGSFKVLPTFYGASGGMWFGSGGASLGITGWAIWQWEAAIGLTIKLG